MDDVKDITVEILRSIRDEIAKLREDTNSQLAGLRRETQVQFDALVTRVDNLGMKVVTVGDKVDHLAREVAAQGAALHDSLDLGEELHAHDRRIRALEAASRTAGRSRKAK